MSFFHSKIAIALSAALLLTFDSWADQVVLKNGDRVTGSIVKKDGKNLTIKADQFGVVTMAWDQVETIKTEKPVNLVLLDGRTAQGTLATSEGKVKVSGPTQLDVSLSEINVLRDAAEQKAFDRLQHPGLTELWAGTASLGLAGTAGNATTLTFTTGVTAARVTNTDKTSIYFNTIKASATINGKNSDTAEAVRGGIGYDHNLSPRIFANVFNDWEYDKFQNLDLRFVIGGGIGLHAMKTDRSRMDLLGGLDYNHSSYSTPLTQSSAEFYFGDDYTLKLTGTTSLVQGFRLFSDLTNTGSYRANFDAGLATKISKTLTWNVSLSDRYLNHPALGRKTNDFLYTTGLGITFAR